MMNKVHNWAKLAGAFSLAVMASGCGIADGALRKPNGSDDGKGGAAGQSNDAVANGSVVDLVMFPPKEYYDYLLASVYDLVDRDQIVNHFAMPQALWINFEGGTVQKGYLPGQSYLVCSSAAVIPPFGISQATRDEIAKKVQDSFASIGANIAVSTTKPTMGEATVIHVGGSYVDLGCPEAKGRQGIAPFDPGNANRSDVGFVFGSSDSNASTLAQTIIHVAGHSFGLDHVSNGQDVMYAWATNAGAPFSVSPLAGGSAVQDGPQVLRQVLTMPWASNSGGTNPQGINLPQPPLYLPGVGYVAAGFPAIPGLTQLAAVGQLTSALGPSQVLDISSLTPRLRGVFAQPLSQTGIAGFERTATVLALVTRAASHQQAGKTTILRGDMTSEDEDLNFGPANSGNSPTPPPTSTPAGLFIDGPLVAQYLTAQAGGQLTVEKLATMAGFPNADAAIKAIQAGLASGSLKMPSDTEFSDLVSIFNLPQAVANVPSLFTGFWASTYYVKGALTGLNLSGMNAALKIAYYQQYKKITASSGH